MPLADLLLERFKVKTRAVENPETTSLGTTAEQVLKNNPNRLGFFVINLSANVVYLALSRPVAGTKGIRLDALGGFFIGIWDELFDATAWAWWGIADGAGSAIYSMEVVER